MRTVGVPQRATQLAAALGRACQLAPAAAATSDPGVSGDWPAAAAAAACFLAPAPGVPSCAFLIGPSSTCAAREAKFREESDSWALAASGLTQQTRRTFELPHRLSCSTCAAGARREAGWHSRWGVRCQHRSSVYAVLTEWHTADHTRHASITSRSTGTVHQQQTGSSTPTCVSLLLRYGTCPFLLCSEAMTSPSADRLLLMACASLSCCPATSLLAMRSEPAGVGECVWEGSREGPAGT